MKKLLLIFLIVFPLTLVYSSKGKCINFFNSAEFANLKILQIQVYRNDVARPLRFRTPILSYLFLKFVRWLLQNNNKLIRNNFINIYAFNFNLPCRFLDVQRICFLYHDRS